MTAMRLSKPARNVGALGFVIVFAVLLVLGGCAAPRTKAPVIDSGAAAAEAEKQKELFVRRLIADHKRLLTIGYPLLVAGADGCGDEVRGTLGFYIAARQDFTGDYAAAAARLFRLSDRPQVLFVVPGSPADLAGFRPGDALLEVGKRQVESGRDFKYIADLLDDVAKPGERVTFKVSRESETQYLTATPDMQCDMELVLTQESEINAYADGERIVVTEGMLRFADSDQHLAVVIGHELAHNTMGHIDAKRVNAAAAGAGGLLLDIGLAVLGVNTQGAFMKAAAQAGAGAYSVAFEQEADYVGLYYMARAGYSLDGAADFWRLMAADRPQAITISNSHPTTPERFVALEQHITEIEAKRLAGEPLNPDLKPERGSEPAENSLVEDDYPD